MTERTEPTIEAVEQVAPAVDVTTEQPVARRRGRPRLHADEAARRRAYREANKLVELRLPADTLATVDRLAEQFDMTRTEALHNLVKFALSNRDWNRLGMTGWKLKDRRFTDASK